MTFGEWKETRISTELPGARKRSFSAWHEKEYGGGRGTAPAVPAVTVEPTAPRASPAADYSYDNRVKQLEETKRQATVDMDFDTVNEADKELKSLRAQEGRQTLGDRVGDVVGASASGTVGGIANTLSTLWGLAGGDPADTVLARLSDRAAADAQRFTQSAKAGLGETGQFAVDAGISGVSLLGDAAANALLPGSGLALTGARSFGSGAQEARQSGANLKEQTLYGLGSAATSMLTEKLGNTSGLLKSAYGSGLLKDPVVGTLGRLALSAVSEGAEEFAEGLAQPLLKRFTYDPDAVYDDDWLSDTLRDTAIGAALGGLGGGVDVMTGRTKTDTDTLAKQENPVPKPETEQKPVRVGRVTTIQRPYTGITPVQTQKSEAVPVVPDASIKAAESKIQRAYQESKADGERSFKSFLKEFVQKTFQRSPGVPVSGMTFEGKPYLVEIGNNVPGKIISSREVNADNLEISAEKLAVLDVLPEVVRNAEYVGSGEYVQHHTKQKLTVRFDYFETETEIGGKPYIVSFDVEVFPNQNNYRTHKINRIELSPASNADLGP